MITRQGCMQWHTATTESDEIKLLKIIKKISFHYKLQRYIYQVAHQAIGALYMTSHKEGVSLEQYLGLDIDNPSSISSDERAEAKRNVKEAYLAWIFLSNANKIKFAPLLGDLANSHLQANDKYPCTITAAHKLLVGWEGGTYKVPGPSNDGIAYTTLREDPEEEESDKEGNVLVDTVKEKGMQRHC
eukprot:7607159-Ditylum_brightwellii.AAC.1